MVSVSASGFFDKIMNLLLSFITSLSTVMLPHIASIFNNGDKQKVKIHFYKYFDTVMFLTFPMAGGVAAISLKFAPWFFGSQFWDHL